MSCTTGSSPNVTEHSSPYTELLGGGGADQSRAVVRQSLARIKLISVAAPLLQSRLQSRRVLQLLRNRREWGPAPPVTMLAVHTSEELDAARAFYDGPARGLARFKIVRQRKHTETMGNAINLFQKELDGTADAFTAKRQILCLTRRGGQGKPTFVSPFLGGEGTTCGEWTRPMVRRPDGTVVKGFMKASVAIGFCPVECPFCYLQMPYTDGMDVALNLEDLADELVNTWADFRYPINFGESSGLIEFDEWFAREEGRGSLVQYVIDACAAARVTPFFLTKIRYPRYLRFDGKVQAGVSLMPEPVRTWLAPNGSPTDELLDSLAWAVAAGACDPVVRLTVIWQQRDLYAQLLEQCRERLGPDGWRLTLDILRFTPGTASIIARRYPRAAAVFARELDPDGEADLAELAGGGIRAGRRVKKIRPPADRQAEIYVWFRNELNRLGCKGVLLTPCKGDPNELTPLARQKVISSMPCACFGVSRPAGERIQLGRVIPASHASDD